MIQPALDFFAERGWQPFPFQQRVWAAYLEGHSGLLHAPTGTGKTFAVWMGPVLDWMDGHTARGGPKTRADAAPLTVLWLTPLRALAADTRQSLQEVVDAFDLPWTVETRTSDTSSTVRSRQRSRLPTALITTPESLSVLLARDNAPAGFAHLRAVIVDEWHELLASKRGVQTELGLARLRRWHPDLRVWGLSATMGNLTEALHALLGTDGQGVLVEGEIAKSVIIDTIIPPTVERFPWAGHIGLKLLPDVIAAIEGVRTALVFCNTRSQVEQWYQAILDARPDWAGLIALHHGSIDYEKRAWVEDALRAGRLKCVVCTSSLDLGVDFPTVDRVFQVSSPKGVARLLQRAGRSGHQPGVQSRVTCVPSHAFELIEIAAARAAAESGRIEARRPLNKPLDVLVQHLVTVALGGGFDPDDLYAEVRTAHAYRDLTPEEWVWALDFVVTGGAALRGYAHFRRVEPDSGRYTVTDDRIAQTHRMAIGTITSSGTLRVKFQRGKTIGYVDEAFAARLKPGDRFALAGRVLEFIRLRELTVTVKLAQSGAKGLVPRWIGGRLPLSEDLTGTIRQKLDEARRGIFTGPEMQAVRPILELQAAWSAVPGPDDLLIERVKTREGHHLFVYPFAGRLVNEGLAALTAYRLARLQPVTFTLVANDYGFELLAPDPTPLPDDLFSPAHLAADIQAALNESQMARRQFREVARVAGLIQERYPGGRKTARQLQASSGLLFDVLNEYDQGNMLLEQARREVLERQLEGSRLRAALHAVGSGSRLVTQPARLTPFAFPLWVSRLRETISSERLADRVARMTVRLEKAASR